MPTPFSASIDCQIVTYLINATESGYNPKQDLDPILQPERVACIRLYLYITQLLVGPTVSEQLERIKDSGSLRTHTRFRDIVLPEFNILHPEDVNDRAMELKKYHPDVEDCRILAETEDVDLAYLVTFDKNFRDRLAPHSKVKLLFPSEYWSKLKIPHGAQPKLEPHPKNPLFNQNWWRW